MVIIAIAATIGVGPRRFLTRAYALVLSVGPARSLNRSPLTFARLNANSRLRPRFASRRIEIELKLEARREEGPEARDFLAANFDTTFALSRYSWLPARRNRARREEISRRGRRATTRRREARTYAISFSFSSFLFFFLLPRNNAKLLLARVTHSTLGFDFGLPMRAAHACLPLSLPPTVSGEVAASVLVIATWVPRDCVTVAPRERKTFRIISTSARVPLLPLPPSPSTARLLDRSYRRYRRSALAFQDRRLRFYDTLKSDRADDYYLVSERDLNTHVRLRSFEKVKG